MKNNKILIIIMVIVLNLVSVVSVGQNFFGDNNKYNSAIESARELSEQNLCSQSINKYNEAVAIKDTKEIRNEMLAVYEKGIDSGEFDQMYDIFVAVKGFLDIYPKDSGMYASVCKFLIKYEQYEDAVTLLKKAKSTKIFTDELDEITDSIRFIYKMNYSMYSGVRKASDGVFTVQNETSYSFIGDSAESGLGGGFSYASTFSEGYAFVKKTNADGKEAAFVIDKNGVRQFYLSNDVVSCSGAGKSYDEDGNEALLYSCLIGGKYQYYNSKGEAVLQQYNFAGRFKNGVAAVEESEGKWHLIDGAGNYIDNAVFSDVVLNDSDECAPGGMIIAATNGKYKIYHLSNDKSMNFSITEVEGFSCDGADAFAGEYAAFKSGSLWGYVDSDGKIVIEPQYEAAKSFSNGIAAVFSDSNWNFINSENKKVITENFEDASYLSDSGKCFIKKDGYWSYIEMYYVEESDSQ